MSKPVRGEIWEDAEGVLMTCVGEDVRTGVTLWWVFANGGLVPSTDPNVAHPLVRAFDLAGNFLLGRPLRYPNGWALREAGPSVATEAEQIVASLERENEFFRDNPRTEATD